ncbi:MAG: HAD-IIA family hydrolase [Nocardioidaceae bacterium]
MAQSDEHWLARSDRPLCEVYDTGMFDLDGVVYVGRHAVPGAPEWMAEAAAAGMHLAFVTNNASRPPRVVAAHLRELGVPARDTDVVTSAQATARLVKGLVPAGAAVLVVGGDGLVEALAEHGLRSVDTLDAGAEAVVQGFGREVGWRGLAEAVAAVDAGLPWVASNLDLTIPTPRGRAPGNGQLVEVVARTTGHRPLVAGKPERPLFDETVRRVGGQRPLVIGDRLDTDIEGASRSGLDSLLVLTGVTGVAELAAAAPTQRPTYLSHDLAGLLASHPAAEPGGDGGRWCCGSWEAYVDQDGNPHLRADDGSPAGDDALRALVAACWAHQDHHGVRIADTPVSAAWRAARASATTATVERDQQ